MSALPVPAEPFDLEAAIAEIIAERMEEMRQREREAMCDAVARGGFIEWLHGHDKGATVALMPVAILGVAWIAEQTMRSM